MNQAITSGDCATAIALIEPLYESDYTDNDVRMARASAHACNIGIKFFTKATELAESDLLGSEFWASMTRLFPSTLADSRYESALAATDALSAILKTGTLVGTQYRVNTDTVNPGSTNANDRKSDANIQMVLISMATIGILQNRYSAPNSSYQKTRRLGDRYGNNTGWNNAARVDEEGCAYAGSILTLFDSVEAVATELGSLGTSLASMVDSLEAGLNAACDAGCSNVLIAGCSLPAGTCTTCPITLRNRASCSGEVTDVESCAAAGIVHSINFTPGFGWEVLM